MPVSPNVAVPYGPIRPARMWKWLRHTQVRQAEGWNVT